MKRERERERESVQRSPAFFGGAPLSAVYSLVSGIGSPASDTGSCKIVSQGICSVFVVCKTVACAGRTRALKKKKKKKKKKTLLLQLKDLCFGFGWGAGGGGGSECSDVTLARVSSSWVELGRGESVG